MYILGGFTATATSMSGFLLVFQTEGSFYGANWAGRSSEVIPLERLRMEFFAPAFLARRRGVARFALDVLHRGS